MGGFALGTLAPGFCGRQPPQTPDGFIYSSLPQCHDLAQMLCNGLPTSAWACRCWHAAAWAVPQQGARITAPRARRQHCAFACRAQTPARRPTPNLIPMGRQRCSWPCRTLDCPMMQCSLTRRRAGLRAPRPMCSLQRMQGSDAGHEDQRLPGVPVSCPLCPPPFCCLWL